MSLLEVTEFKGRAQVMGKVTDVCFDGESLTIWKLTLAEANALLNHLAIGLKSVELPVPATAQAGRTSSAQPNLSNPPRDVSTQGKAEPPKTDGAAERAAERAAAKTASKPDPSPKEDDLPGDLGQGPPPGNVVPIKPPAQPGVFDPAKYSGFKRMREVVTQLQADGFTTVQELAAKCIALKATVVFLTKVDDADMERRVTGALEAAKTSAS